PGAAADIDCVAVRIVEEGTAAEVVGHLHVVARIDLLELRRRQLPGDGAAHGDALARQEFAQHFVHGVRPLVDQGHLPDAGVAGPTASTVEDALTPVWRAMNSIMRSCAATPMRVGSGVPLCTTRLTPRSISLSRFAARGLSSARSTSLAENSARPIGIITCMTPAGAS